MIDDVGLGWGGGWGGGGGVNNVPLDIHLHDDLFLLIASTGSRHTDALPLIDDVGLGWGVGGERVTRAYTVEVQTASVFYAQSSIL